MSRPAVAPPRSCRGIAPRISVVIPTYNEAVNLPHVFDLMPDDVHEVVVVDGRSVEVARSRRPDARILLQNSRGRGNATACGSAAVTGDIAVMVDADGSVDSREIPVFVEALVSGADFATVTWFAGGGGSADVTRTRAWGNRWLNRIANAFFGTRYTDLCYGYNAPWAHRRPALTLDAGDRGHDGGLRGDGFEMETITSTRIAKAGLRTDEVPGFEFGGVHGGSDLNAWRDGFRVLRALLVERFDGVGRDGARRRRSLWDARRPLTGRSPAAGCRAGEETPGSRTA